MLQLRFWSRFEVPESSKMESEAESESQSRVSFNGKVRITIKDHRQLRHKVFRRLHNVDLCASLLAHWLHRIEGAEKIGWLDRVEQQKSLSDRRSF